MATSNKTTTLALAVVVTLVVAGTGGYMLGKRGGQAEAEVGAKAVATVNGEKITQTELYDVLVKENGSAQLDQLITKKLVAQEAKKANVTITPADVQAELDKTIASFGGPESFKQFLQYYQMTEEQFRETIEIHVAATKILGKDIKVEDAEAKTYFDENQNQFDKRQVKARHILVNTEDEAKAIKAQLDGGADFTALAKEKSIEPAAKETGGDLGTFGRGTMVPEFETATYALTKGQISAPVQTQHGWHVIQLLDMTGDAPDFEKQKDEVKSAIVEQKVGEQFSTWMSGLKEKATISNTLAK